MTNLRDEIADVVNDFSVGGFVEDEHALADAILAKIKASVPELVWIDYPMGSRCDTNNDYSINYWQYEDVFVDAYTTMHRHKTLESAKAAANAHHVAQLTDWMMK